MCINHISIVCSLSKRREKKKKKLKRKKRYRRAPGHSLTAMPRHAKHGEPCAISQDYKLDQNESRTVAIRTSVLRRDTRVIAARGGDALQPPDYDVCAPCCDSLVVPTGLVTNSQRPCPLRHRDLPCECR